MLKVRLIGTFDIKCDGKSVTISSRVAQSLFAYLILDAGTIYRREKLAGMFWPDAPEEKARAYLRHELWRIRKAFSSKSTFDYLIADDINISFNASAEYWLDAEALEKLNDTSSADELMVALSTYHGELLPGFYDDWITQEREHLQAVYEQKIAQLLGLLEDEKRWQEILDWAERWISSGHVPEAGYRYLMIAYDALGDRAKVASTYQRCVQALRELDLEPSEQTRALAFKRTSKLNIPIPLTSFIGRENELKEVAGLLSKSRLVTLTGSGGIGKTRLAIQVVADILERFPDGVWFLDLAPLSDPALLPYTLANLLGLRESGELSVTDRLTIFFRSRSALVILDNCEHLIEPCAQLVHSLLTSCEGLSILATSREVLGVSGETSYRVPSLTIPRSDVQFSVYDVANMESVKLFTERAAFISPGFAFNSQNALDIARICQRLDGIPLAIELAAARANVLTTEQILKRLDDRFRLLTGGVRTALPRHQTLRAMIDWSHDLLSEPERVLFRQLSVFAGGWTLEAAESVCADLTPGPIPVMRAEIASSLSGHVAGEVVSAILDLLTSLVNKSLLLAERIPGQETRYYMLETIREFAREKLAEASESNLLADRHLEYFLRLAEAAEPYLRREEQVKWLKRLDPEHDNLRLAVAWAMQKPSATVALKVSGALGSFWNIRAYDLEGAQWLDQALKKEWDRNSPVDQRARAKALYRRADMASALDELEVLKISAESALKLFEELQDNRGIAYSRMLIAVYHILLRLPQAGISLLQESLHEFQRLGDAWAESRALDWLAHALINTGIREGYFEAQQRALVCARASGDRLRIAQSLLSSVGNLINTTRWYEAEKILQEVELLYGEVDSTKINWVFYYGTQIFFALGKLDMAKSAAHLFIAYCSRVGERTAHAVTLFFLAWIAETEHDLSAAAEYGQQGLELFRELKNPALIAFGLMVLGFFQYEQGNAQAARQNARESLEIARRGEVGIWVLLYVLCHLGGIFMEKKPQIAVQMLALSEACAQAFPTPRDPLFDQPYFERFLAAARAKLSEADFNSMWEIGLKLRVEAAIEVALNTIDELQI